jgi:hypothetical protein
LKERWPSGLRRTPGERVTAKSGTRVRIPLSPQGKLISIFYRIKISLSGERIRTEACRKAGEGRVRTPEGSHERGTKDEWREINPALNAGHASRIFHFFKFKLVIYKDL